MHFTDKFLQQAWLREDCELSAQSGLRFADCGYSAEEHVRKHLRDCIAAESGANDGLGFPFIYLVCSTIVMPEVVDLCNQALYLLYVHDEGLSLSAGLQRWVVHIVSLFPKLVLAV